MDYRLKPVTSVFLGKQKWEKVKKGDEKSPEKAFTKGPGEILTIR